MTRRFTILAALALVLTALPVFYSVALQGSGLSGAAYAQDNADPKDIDTSMIPEMSIGNPESSVTVIEYASFTCPHCARFHSEVFGKLKAEYIDTGKINFIYREVYFDRYGLWAAIVARCGEGAENRYFGISDMLYDQQSVWARQDDPAAIVESLRKMGKTAGLTDAQLDQCLTDGDNAQALYALWLQRSESEGVNSTPTFFINGTKYSNMPYDEFKAILDEKLGG